MTKIKDIIQYLETVAPPQYQEDYDNSGLMCGSLNDSVKGVIITLDSTEEVVDEAINKKCNLVIAHHPIIFKAVKSLTGKNYVERTIIKAIKNDIAIYAFHTNFDNVIDGVNSKICEKLGLTNNAILVTKNDNLNKLVSFVPKENTFEVLNELHKTGAGNIGNYSNCSFRVEGTGTFMPKEGATPKVGKANLQEEVEENRIEVIFPAHLSGKMLNALKKAHPYEEVAYFLQPTTNRNLDVGSGMIGELKKPMPAIDFLIFLKEKMNLELIRHTKLTKDTIKKVAVCGGSGSFLLKAAISKKADVFISADFKYHEFFDAEDKIIIADIGHYESEVFTKELIYEILSKKFSTFALNLSGIKTNPINYL